jgi:GT2 family glycosyltransferase
MLVRKSIIENVGLFDPHFHSYFEESDFCWRVWLSGSSVVYFPGIDIYHKVGFASKRLPQTIVTYHGIKNRIFSLFKNLDTGHLFSIFLIHIVFLFCLAAYYLIRLQFEKAYMIYKGLLWNLIHLRLLVVSRSQVQKIRTVSDRIIFSSIMHPIQPIKLFQHFLKVEANFK